jgi:hypothetical protein
MTDRRLRLGTLAAMSQPLPFRHGPREIILPTLSGRALTRAQE